MDSFVSTLCGENYFSDLAYPGGHEQHYENDLISDCSISSDTTLHNLHSSPYGYRLQSEPQDLVHTPVCSPDIGTHHQQPIYHTEWATCYPTTYTMDAYSAQVAGIKTDPYQAVHTGYDEYQQEKGGSYRDADSYDSDTSVELVSDFCTPTITCTNMQIKTEKSSKTRLPAFTEFFTDKTRHSKGCRGRPVTYKRPGSNFVDSDDFDSEEDERLSLCNGSKVRRGAKNILLWKFLLEELVNKKATHVQWVNRVEGTFKFVDTAECSKLWGLKKKKEDMNFEKLSRGIRHYYRDGLMSRLDGTRLVYKFNWDRVPKAFRKMAKVF